MYFPKTASSRTQVRFYIQWKMISTQGCLVNSQCGDTSVGFIFMIPSYMLKGLFVDIN